MNTLLSFAEATAHRLWHGKHLRDSQYMIQRLSNFNGNATKALDSFKAADIYAFVDHLKDQGLTDSTVNRYLACFSCLFGLAVEYELMTQAPKVRWKKVRNSRPRFFTGKEIEDLLAFLTASKNPWMAQLVILGLNTGMRLGEILSINQLGGKTYGAVSECGRFIYLSDTKTGEDRTVPLNQAAREALAALNMRPSEKYTHRRFYDTWNEARDELARGDKHYVFHVLRHTCATRLAMEFNIDSITLGKILGHRSQATTAKYVHAKPESLAAIMTKLEGAA